MLKSFKFIDEISKKLEILKNNEIISDFMLDLTLSQNVTIYIVSDSLNSFSDISPHISKSESFVDYEITYVFLTNLMKKSDEYSYLFKEGSKINYGVRRTLNNLIEPASLSKNNIKTPVVTFYSYKGGVGRTTSLALFSRYYANLGKKVFVLDCDFEAPGLINFFGISQFDNPKNGIVEYINDKKFDASTSLNEDYVYEVSSVYSGEGRINLMPAGNVFGTETKYYLEGLARVDVNGPDSILKEFKNIFNDIEINYTPDVILVDSRTGFNNVFGALSQLSHTIVGLAGDDHQNQPGLSMLLDKFVDEQEGINLCLVLSIISSSIPKRVSAFRSKIESLLDTEIKLPVFHFQRATELELIGTDSESLEDVQFFTSDQSSFYFPFFDYLSTEISNSNIEEPAIEKEYSGSNIPEASGKQIITPEKPINSGTPVNELQDKILSSLIDNYPEPYAEHEKYNDQFYREKFYIRQCMQDLFLPEYKILLGGKGTGKTSFYKALQEKNFFDALTLRAEKKHLKFSIKNIISERGNEGFISFSNQFSNFLKNESDVRKLWVTYIWVSIAKKYNKDDHCLFFVIKNNQETVEKFSKIINSSEFFGQVEKSLDEIDTELKRKDERLIITFDQLDFVVKPIDWDKGISPLISLSQSITWERINPKLFLRRDLYNKLGNITNKNSLSNKTINLEWSQEELYAFLFKVVFSLSKDEFIEFLKRTLPDNFIQQYVVKKLNKANQYNQLAADSNILKPLVKTFFGSSYFRHITAYDGLYNNLRNADKTVSLRPFLDLIRLAIDAQVNDKNRKRGDAVLSAKYCDNKAVRSGAVDTYFNDLAKEEGNELIRYFVEDIRNNLVPKHLKCSSLEQHDFEELISCVKSAHANLDHFSVTEFEDDLKLNGIIFVTYIAGHRKKYSFAFLYMYYLDLISPKAMAKAKKEGRA